MNLLDGWDLDTLTSVATMIGIGVAAWQIREGRQISELAFEDSLDQQYRSLALVIPVDAFIGKNVPEDKKYEAREAIYNYIDLCNEQAFLRSMGRVRCDTWKSWCAGMKQNFGRSAFSEVWQEIKSEGCSDTNFGFSYLLKLEESNFSFDPLVSRWRWKR